MQFQFRLTSVNRERLLLKLSITGLPQHLGEDQLWNQVVFRWHIPRTTGCYHCHLLFDHNLSVSDGHYGILC